MIEIKKAPALGMPGHRVAETTT